MCCGNKRIPVLRCPKCNSVLIVTSKYARCGVCGLLIEKGKYENLSVKKN